MKKTRKNRKGFTLVELMVVVVIIGILTAIAIPVYMSVTANAEAKTCQANQRTIDSVLMIYNTEHTDAKLTNVAADEMEEIFVTVDANGKYYLAEIPECPTNGAGVYSIENGLAKTTCTTDKHILHN